MLQEIQDNLRIAVEQGRTDIIRSVLEACKSLHRRAVVVVEVMSFCTFSRNVGIGLAPCHVALAVPGASLLLGHGFGNSSVPVVSFRCGQGRGAVGWLGYCLM